MVGGKGTVDWVMGMVWPRRVMLAVRGAVVVLAVKLKLTTPLVTPVMVSHGWSLVGANGPARFCRGRQHHRQRITSRRRALRDRICAYKGAGQFLDRVVGGVGDIDIARPIHRHAPRITQSRGRMARVVTLLLAAVHSLIALL